MKKLIYFFAIVPFFFSIQCSNEIPTANNAEKENLGKVSLKINKEYAPDNVVLVEAFLSRANHDTIYGALNIMSSTSADIFLDDIAVGEWHLKVDAKDSQGVILYTGETDVSVNAGILTQINLTLIPTGNGTGSIYLYVNWGTSTGWTDFINNPLVTIEDSPFNPLAVAQATIIHEGNIFKMWYNNVFPSAVVKVGYAQSNDGINWILNSSYALVPGESGSWDDYSVNAGYVLKENNKYLMYYEGNQGEHGYWHIGLATSSDGINWSKNPNPILLGDNKEPQLHPNTVIKVNSVYIMYYTIRNPISSYQSHSIGMAISNDGINWEKYSQNPILSSNQGWEEQGIYYPSVIYDDNQFKMVFMNASANGFGFAASSDGYNWTKNNSNPFFTKDDTNNNWASRIAYPFLMKTGNEYRIYYSGGSYGYNLSIGLVRKF